MVNWTSLAVLAVLLAICLATTNFSIHVDEHFAVQFATTAGVALTAHYAFSMRWIRLSYILGVMALFTWLSIIAADLSFIVASLNLPLQDRNLANLDRILGLDWQAYQAYVYAHPSLIPYLDYGYNCLVTWPALVIPIALSLAHQHVRLQQFVFASILMIVLIVLVSAVVPAMGTYYEYGIAPDLSKLNPSGYVAQIDRLPLVRDGSLRLFNSTSIGGIIAFPSLHAAIPVLSCWALWTFRWIRPLVVTCSADILFATPLFGGHYFIDVFAGILVAAASICAALQVAQLSVRSTSGSNVLTQSATV
ncbi:phosphatase PAP2 family protein [Bradyrhizobium guangxiense]|uniref:phosphatase PAP2 family protein n=1 Tax=Bradyrhizobium guangxiense TaxID=1325115 RepID=UPI0013E8C78A|nr:phosphatase PAP2 family protein [Bradyrhizobium guangxiense]